MGDFGRVDVEEEDAERGAVGGDGRKRRMATREGAATLTHGDDG